jgi:hypothetical protein
VLFEMEDEFADAFARTAASPFRSATDISVTNSFYHYYALLTGRAVVQTEAKVQYVETTLFSALKEMDTLLKKRSMDMFCLNDGSKPEIDVETRTSAVISFLERYFPFPAPWEQEAIDAEAADGDPALTATATVAPAVTLPTAEGSASASSSAARARPAG